MGFFYDYSKAFYRIQHDLLFQKLKQYGIRGQANYWIKLFRKNRYQSVKIFNSSGSHHSEKVKLTSGVPQGATISPLLFIIFTNDLANSVNEVSLTTYADDTTHLIGASTESFNRVCKDAISQLATWSLLNGLKLNCDKTVIINYNPKIKQVNAITPLLYLHGTLPLGFWTKQGSLA